MPGKSSNSPLGRMAGLVVAGLAAVLLVLERATDLSVPYGYDGGGVSFLVGASAALLVVIAVGWRYRDTLFN